MTVVNPRSETEDTAPADLPRRLDVVREKVGALPSLSNPAMSRHGP